MTPRQIADVAVARLALPVPTAKLVTAQALGRALRDDTDVFCDALASWLSSRESESECLEGLCPLLSMVPGPSDELVTRLRQAIARPSLASDLMLSIAADCPVRVPAWRGAHLDPALTSMDLSEELAELRSAKFVPPLFHNRLEELQDEAHRPFLHQWAFEYRMRCVEAAEKADGYLGHFLDTNREQVGQFVSRRGHMARSAYLRTLACAVEHWELPQDVAFNYASLALPAEPIFLRVVPQRPPPWAPEVHSHSAEALDDPEALVRAVVHRVEESQRQRLMHCAMSIVDRPDCRADLEVFAAARISSETDPHAVISFYHWLLGKQTPMRDGLRAFVSPPLEDNFEKLGFAPLVVPLVGFHVGYLQTDLLGRVPYVPVSGESALRLELSGDEGGALFRSGDRAIGRWAWWLWNWNPGHLEDSSAPMACCASLQSDVAQQLAKDQGAEFAQAWKLTVWRRDANTGKWRSKEQAGFIT